MLLWINVISVSAGKVDDGNGGLAHASDRRPYTTLLYGDGPGYSVTSHSHRPDITHTDTSKNQSSTTTIFRLRSVCRDLDMFSSTSLTDLC